MKKLLALALLGTMWVAVPGAEAVTISSGVQTGNIESFGFPNSQTYGQVFTAPITGTLDSFTLYLNGGVGGSLYGGVGVWNGTSSYSSGGGVSSIAYQSSNIASATSAFAYTFLPHLSVTQGQLYVAFLSVFGAGASSQTSMPLANNNSDPNVNYFVWNNGASPASASWNYFFNTGDAKFDAKFSAPSPVPLPAALPLLAAGLGALGVAARKRRARSS